MALRMILLRDFPRCWGHTERPGVPWTLLPVLLELGVTFVTLGPLRSPELLVCDGKRLGEPFRQLQQCPGVDPTCITPPWGDPGTSQRRSRSQFLWDYGASVPLPVSVFQVKALGSQKTTGLTGTG